MKALIITASVIAVLYVSYRIFRIVTLDKGLEAKISKGAIILDVRTKGEFETGHIKGAINISLGEIRERYIELDKNETYITCCSHGLRSVKVESILKEKGFKNVYNGGAWSDLEILVKKTLKK